MNRMIVDQLSIVPRGGVVCEVAAGHQAMARGRKSDAAILSSPRDIVINPEDWSVNNIPKHAAG